MRSLSSYQSVPQYPVLQQMHQVMNPSFPVQPAHSLACGHPKPIFPTNITPMTELCSRRLRSIQYQVYNANRVEKHSELVKINCCEVRTSIFRRSLLATEFLAGSASFLDRPIRMSLCRCWQTTNILLCHFGRADGKIQQRQVEEWSLWRFVCDTGCQRVKVGYESCCTHVCLGPH